ncbi:hypothetical protein AALO_G00037030 [Alosa alosa]|uniref:Ig-like domain-containing protein n=1 Tax=Alosa alosa TaxID=278164 RepID=A0AAV6H7B4_9TELE|nr:uncharacterized protein LOC125292681 [Alosa alosa]KAG5282989.1 hypothetical protein AALO_G00037030 [Alosa alosa]
MARVSTGLLGVGFCLALLSCRGTDRIMAIHLIEPQGKHISLLCNTSGNLSNIKWEKEETLIFAYSPQILETKTNFTSDRMSIDPATPTMLLISNVQESDEGIYTCHITTVEVPFKTQTWNLTVYPDDNLPPQQHIYIIIFTSVGIFIILISCGILCIYRIKKKQNASTLQQPNESRTPEHLDQRQDQRIRRHQSSQYFERYNSVYGQL